LNWEDVQPEDGVLVLHPLQSMDPDDTTAFMKAGGRLAILDDYGLGDETLSRFHIDRIPPPLRPVRALRDRAALAIAEPIVDTVAGPSVGPPPWWPTFSNWSRTTPWACATPTSHPSFAFEPSASLTS
jgi:hypothetical protein